MDPNVSKIAFKIQYLPLGAGCEEVCTNAEDAT